MRQARYSPWSLTISTSRGWWTLLTLILRRAFRSTPFASAPTAAIAPICRRLRRSLRSCRGVGRSSHAFLRRFRASIRASRPRPRALSTGSSTTSTAAGCLKPASTRLFLDHNDGRPFASVIVSQEALHALALAVFGDPQQRKTVIEGDADHRGELDRANPGGEPDPD